MIATVDIAVQAKFPNMPLTPMFAYMNSPSSIRLRNVPKKIGNWQINQVTFFVAYPDNTTKSVGCVLVGGMWVGTVEGSTRAGKSINGYTIFASGVDENGYPVENYVLGKGDVTILQADGTIDPEDITYYVHLLSAQSDEPKEGDLWQNDGTYYIWQNGQAWPIGDDSGLIDELSAKIENKADLSALDEKADLSALNEKADLSTLNEKADLSALDNKADLSTLNEKADLSAVLNLSGDTQMVLQTPGFMNGIYLDGLELRGTESGAVATIQYVGREISAVNSELSTKRDLSDMTAVIGEQYDSWYLSALFDTTYNPAIEFKWTKFVLNGVETYGWLGHTSGDDYWCLLSSLQYLYRLSQIFPNYYNVADNYDIQLSEDELSIISIDASAEQSEIQCARASKEATLTTSEIATEDYVDANTKYNLISAFTNTLVDGSVQLRTLTLSSTQFNLPMLVDGKVNDFVLDIANKYTENDEPAPASFTLAGTLGTDYYILVPDGEDFSEMTTLEAGELAEYYFTRTAFLISDTGGMQPAWKVVKQKVTNYTLPTI